ncbi:DUF3467 domain-containing protein [Owenweeksia hongkongensis]|uniref:DUF3467 domain-containing protein n=1 Tax=Owenweeksia hongkongensis (strain DSM 17368 / CIP 108786 / JCM 12287 / NRRL B-23963 / UST20020801) TaxID=926562 RepID=G8R896_OWEHD|nr:DUF3467 domain-containing protein [Owenweeksia hongkongensis]AEV32464.1 Protein of unknown function (DUF3467) [Owenweeksia hongkongensis DSM 17368]
MADENQQMPKEGQVNVELSEEIAEGIYSNLAIINHSSSEFVLDFIKIMPGVPKARVKSRIVLTPQHAKRFLRAMQDNVARFEAQHGEIKDIEQPQIPLNFGGPTGQA